MITTRDLTCDIGARRILDGVDLTISDHGMLGIVGPNGSGKTTLIRALFGALRPAGGVVLIDDRPLPTFSRPDIARRVAVVVQESPTSLPMTVAESVLLGRLPHPGTPEEAAVSEALHRVDCAHLAQRPVSELSGGERQRVLIARALAQDTSHLLLDEPTNHLDIRYQHEILGLLRSLDIGVGVVLHDLNLAARYCDRIAIVDEGRISALGAPTDVLTPDILEPIYHVGVERLELPDGPHLVFRV